MDNFNGSKETGVVFCMKILFLANDYMGLAMPILKEMQRQGHEVLYIPDNNLSTDCYLKNSNRFFQTLRNIYNILFRVYQRYWKKNTNINCYYDLLFCIQGVSFHPYLLRILKKYNPNIKTSLYIWDSNKYYDYIRNAKYFDKVFTFDIEDSKCTPKIKFLPFYWIPNENDECTNNKYDISIVGSDHDGRTEIVEKVYKQIDNKLKCYFRIVANRFPFQVSNRGKLIFTLLFRYNQFLEIVEKYKHKLTLPFIAFDYIQMEQVNSIIQNSNCILDTDRECQTGTTPRLIWALAMGKKIISTNTHLVEMPFYDEKQIQIIDRNNPIVDIDFIQKEELFKTSAYVICLRIDNWIKNFIEF